MGNSAHRAVVGLLTLLAAGGAWAQPEYPSKPIRLIVPFSPGGGTDIVARALSQKLAESWRQPVVVDNRSGAGGTIGTETAVRAASDGYTLVMVSGSYAANPALYKLTYDPLNDITPISMIGESGYLLTLHPAMPIGSVRELVVYAKANPGKLNYASTGTGSSTHLAVELFEFMAGTKMTHVPYKSSAPALTDLLGRQIQLMFGPMLVVMPQLIAGRVRSIAITTLKRSSVLPDIPTVAESGVPGYEAVVWYGMLGPKGLPSNIVSRWNTELARILHTPELKERMAHEGLEIPDTTAEYYRRVLRRDIAKWQKVVTMGNIKPGS